MPDTSVSQTTATGIVDAAPFFRAIELDAAEVPQHSGLLNRIRGGDLHGAIVHGVYEPEALAAVVARLEQHDPPFLKTWFPDAFRAWFYGRNLNLTEPDLPGYFDEAAIFNAQLNNLFPPGLGIGDHLAGILSALDNGRRFAPPPGPGPGEHYMFTTLRAHMDGGFIPAHCDNELALRPAYRHLRTLIQPHIFSFVLALTTPDRGGAFEIFNSRFEPSGSELISDDAMRSANRLDGVDSATIRLAPGSMVIVDSGQYLHRVTKVKGANKRWTVCSFMAMGRNRDVMYCWG
jgi:hypothetical protein